MRRQVGSSEKLTPTGSAFISAVQALIELEKLFSARLRSVISTLTPNTRCGFPAAS